MQDIGNVLEKARNEKQISLEQASRETNIARRYLEALETGMYEVFPGEPYIIGVHSSNNCGLLSAFSIIS